MQEKTIRRLQRQKLRKKKICVYNAKIYVRKNRCLQRQNLRERKKIGVYSVKNYARKKIGVYNVKIWVRKKNRRLQRQNLREKKKSAFTTSKFTWEKKIGVYNVKIYVKTKKWGLQRHRQRQPEPHTSAETQKANYRGSSLNQYIHIFARKYSGSGWCFAGTAGPYLGSNCAWKAGGWMPVQRQAWQNESSAQSTCRKWQLISQLPESSLIHAYFIHAPFDRIGGNSE